MLQKMPALAAAVTAVFTILAVSAFAQTAPHCAAGTSPQFVLGFAALKAQVGPAMGDPVECEYPDPLGTGDTEQHTTTGLAFFRKSTNTPTFTDGYSHWALAPRGLVTWTGSAIDPPPPQKTYAAQAVAHDWFNTGILDDAAARCGVSYMTELNPDQNPRDAACVVDAMTAAGLDSTAIRFFTETNLLLTDFHPHGHIDIGYASAPWVNMGRPQVVFLNGDPAAVPIFAIERPLLDAWQRSPAGASMKQRYPNVGLWTEYSREGSDETLPEGGQRVVIEFVLQESRPGPIRGWLPIAFTFNAAGALTGTQLLPIKSA